MKIGYLFPLLLLFSFGCASLEYTFTEQGIAYKKAEDRYRVGDYDGAIDNSIDSLSKKPGYKKASLLISEAAPKAYEQHEKRAKELEEQADWEHAVGEYDVLINLADKLNSIEGNSFTIDTQTIIVKRDNASKNGAEMHYSKGTSLMESARYKEAASEFEKCQHFIPGYKNARSLYIESRTKAIIKVAIMPFENQTGRTEFGHLGILLTKQITFNALNLNEEFVKFISKDSLELMIDEQQIEEDNIEKNPREMGKMLGVNAFVFGKVSSLITSYPAKKSESYDRKTAIYRKEDEGGSYNVTAKCTYYTQRREVTITAEFQIVSTANGNIVAMDTVKSNAIDEVKWAQFKGDERALTQVDIDLCNQGEIEPESEDVLVNRAMEELNQKILQSLLVSLRKR